MRTLVIGLAMSAALAGAGLSGAAMAATPNAELAAPIHQFFDSFAKGDMAAVAAAYAPGAITIVDELPPYSWRGPDALKNWLGDLGKDVANRGLTEVSATVGEVSRAEVDGDNAYVIVPAVYAYKQHGAPMHEPSQITFTLVRIAGAWKISGWTWTGPTPTAVVTNAKP